VSVRDKPIKVMAEGRANGGLTKGCRQDTLVLTFLYQQTGGRVARRDTNLREALLEARVAGPPEPVDSGCFCLGLRCYETGRAPWDVRG